MKETIRAFWTTLPPQRRVVAVCAAAITGLSAYSLWLASEAAVVIEPNRTTERKTLAVQVSPSYMPEGYRTETIVRDPFTPPQTGQKSDRDKPVMADRAGLPLGKNTPRAAQMLQQPVLTGIIAGETSRVAILEYKGQSDLYRLQDMLGPYQLLAVSERSVVLNSPDGQLTLTLGR